MRTDVERARWISLPTHLLEGFILSLALVVARPVSGAEVAPRKGAEALVRMTQPATVYESLPWLREVPELTPLMAASDALPKQTFLVPTTDQQGRTLKLAVHEWGAGTNATVVVLIHGVMADHRVWHAMAGALGQEHDLWLVDLPGVGDSDAPDPARIGADAYSPTAMAGRIWQALTARLAARNPQPRLVLVGHSLGGLVVLRMMSAPELRESHPVAREQVLTTVLLAPCDVAVHKAIPEFVAISRLTAFKIGAGRILGVLRERIAKITTASYWMPARASKDMVEMALHHFTDSRHRHAIQATLRQAAPFTDNLRPNWAEIHRLEAECQSFLEPVLIAYGDSDETLPNSMGFKLAASLPQAQLCIVRRSKHMMPIEHPRLCAQLVSDAMASTRPEPAAASSASGLARRPAFKLMDPDDFGGASGGQWFARPARIQAPEKSTSHPRPERESFGRPTG